MNTTFSIKESFSFAWGLFKQRPWYFIGISVLAIVIIGGSDMLLRAAFGPDQNAIGSIIGAIIGVLVDMGLITIALRAHEDVHAPRVATLWAPHPFWKYIGASILVGIIVIIGFIIVIIPGVIAMLGLMFTKYAVMDRHMGPVEALKESWRITKGHRWHLLGFLICTIVLNLIGVIVLLVGLLVTIPITMLATVHIYRQLAHASSEVETAPVSA